MTTREKLLANAEKTRSAIQRDVAAVRHMADLPARTMGCFERHPVAWLAGAAVAGWILAGPKTRLRTLHVIKDKEGKILRKKKQPGLAGTLLRTVKLALPVLKPALKAYATRRLMDFVRRAG